MEDGRRTAKDNTIEAEVIESNLVRHGGTRLTRRLRSKPLLSCGGLVPVRKNIQVKRPRRVADLGKEWSSSVWHRQDTKRRRRELNKAVPTSPDHRRR